MLEEHLLYNVITLAQFGMFDDASGNFGHSEPQKSEVCSLHYLDNDLGYSRLNCNVVTDYSCVDRCICCFFSK